MLVLKKKICLITFSNNADHQNVIYSMFEALISKTNVYTIGIKNPKSNIAPHTKNNFYVDCPERPGITKNTFNFKELKRIVKIITENKIDILYFESQHIWNAMLMALCPNCKKIVAVHDVIPHDGNKSMTISNYVTCQMANHIVLRNKKYYNELMKRYHVPREKITQFDAWRFWLPEKNCNHTGVFLCFGRIRKYKGFDLLLQIIEKTPKINFQIVGDPDEESQALVQKIKDLPNTTVIDREVSDEDMESFFNQADWIILPYSAATQSGVIIDAYKYSRPVISFDVGAISEQIINGKTGFLIPEGNIQEFCDTIEKVNKLSSNQLLSYCHNSYVFGMNKYSAKGASERFLSMINQL